MTGIANQHEIIADSLAQNVVKELQQYIKELKEERSKHFKDAKQEEQALNSSIRKLDHVSKMYFTNPFCTVNFRVQNNPRYH